MKRSLFMLIASLWMWGACTTPRSVVQEGMPEVIEATAFDTLLQGDTVSLYTLRNANGMLVQLTNYGARIVAMWVPDQQGIFRDVVWGYPSIADYLNSPDRFSGPIVGRYGNRIAKGQFTLDGKSYQLSVNDGENHLHGGADGLWNRVWKARSLKLASGEEAVEMRYLSPDGDAGYPGNLQVTVTYALQRDNALRIDYRATTDAPTIVNLTSHSYFNLHGTSDSSTNSHLLAIRGSRFTPTDDGLIPTGAIDSVKGTPLDFTTLTPIGSRINEDFEALRQGKGYDQNWVLDKASGRMTTAAELYEPSNGIFMQVMTDQPALQFYSGNFMNGTETGKRGDKHNYRTGVALETQNYPDAPNHPNFPSAVLRPGETYTHTCIYAFRIQKVQP